jgi:hypothetical protein
MIENENEQKEEEKKEILYLYFYELHRISIFFTNINIFINTL